MKIPFAEDLALPIDAVTQTFAFLAKRGWGKTYAAKRLAEGMLDASAQVVAIDPVGVWYGLRLAADGKSECFQIPVFGGLHGDLPLTPESGRLVAALIVEKGISAILDVSSFRKGERVRFLTDFAEELFHRKKAARTPLHLFLEEAQTFIPQKVFHDEARLLGAFEDIIKLGRNFGIGVTLISQRPQAVNKECLNLTEVLVVGQMMGPQERKTIEGWIVEHDLNIGDLVDELPSLPRGTGWLWSPSWLGKTVKIHIGRLQSFDTSKTPEPGSKQVEPRTLEPVELEEIRKAMGDVVEKARADDPKALRRRIADLEAAAKKVPAAKVERVEVPVLDEKRAENLRRAAEGLLGVAESLKCSVESIDRLGRDLMAGLSRAARGGTPAQPRLPMITPGSPCSTMVRRDRPRVATESNGSISGPAQRVLDALAELAVMGIHQPDRVQVALLAGYGNLSSKGFANAMGSLKSAGHIHYPDPGTVGITPSGSALASEVEVPRTPAEVQERLLTLLGGVHGRILRPLIEAYPQTVTRTLLAELAGYGNLSSKGFANGMGRLRSLKLIDYPETGEVRATGILFLEGSR